MVMCDVLLFAIYFHIYSILNEKLTLYLDVIWFGRICDWLNQQLFINIPIVITEWASWNTLCGNVGQCI